MRCLNCDNVSDRKFCDTCYFIKKMEDNLLRAKEREQISKPTYNQILNIKNKLISKKYCKQLIKLLDKNATLLDECFPTLEDRLESK